MNLDLAGKTVLITGGSKGIGRATALVMAEEGADVILVARNADGLSAAADMVRERAQVSVRTLAADLSQQAEVERVAGEVESLDILVNNAGAIPGGGLLDLTMETWEQAWSLKVMGYIHLTQIYLGAMKARGAGTIVNIIGAAGRSPRYDYICGGTGNAALMAFTSGVGGKSVDWGVRVFGINPASTRTDRIVTLAKTRAKAAHGDESRWQEMLTNLPLNRLIEPAEIANTAAFLASPACGYVSGTVMDVDGGGAFRG